MRRRAFVVTAAATVVALAGATPASAAPGDLDPSFHGTGEAIVQVSNLANDEAEAVALTPDGRVVVAGRVVTNDGGDFAIVRLKPDGYPDLTFSRDGRMTFTAGDDSLNDLAVDPTGRIVAGGGTDQDGMLVFRVTRGGRLDRSFSGDGKAGPAPDTVGKAQAIAIQPDAKVLAVATDFDTNTIVAFRFTVGGALDATFDHDGERVIAMPGAASPRVNDVAVDSHGRILLAADTGTPSSNDVVVLRLHPNGSLDRSFSGDGRVVIDFGPDDDDPSLAVRPNDEVVVGATVDGLAGDAVGLVQLAADGNLDSTFGGDGRVVVDLSAGDDELQQVALQGNGAIVIEGDSGSGDSTIFVARIRPNGTTDMSFAGGDKVLNPSVGNDSAAGVAVGPAGIVAAGTADDGQSHLFYAARLEI